jgi:hypothetical protein
MTTAKRKDPELWEKVKEDVTEGGKGGRKGQWSARKAQLAVHEYKKRGGAYVGGKRESNGLHQWTEEDWGTKSGKTSQESGERYLPKKAREALSSEEYRRTSDKKRKDTRKGKQFSGQPDDVARKTAPHRHGGRSNGKVEATKAELYEQAKRQSVPGRSKMSKEELRHAVE